MNEDIKKLSPEILWKYFGEILEVPRPSKKEEKIVEYLINFAKVNQLDYEKDATGNILIRKGATLGYENKKIVVLQSHIDMVCEKNNDTVHDFDNDPIQAYIEDGWVKAKGTTLGGDDGIGVAAQLALLVSSDIEHGPIECLFTVDEETGLTGAFGLEPDFLKADILLNLDSEDEGELFIGCAGGIDTVVELPFDKTRTPENHNGYKLTVKGLCGGHSGDDINKGLANANKVLVRLLFELEKDIDICISEFDGGNLRNAIAREANANVAIPQENAQQLEEYVNSYCKTLQNEYKVTEPNLVVTFEKIEIPESILNEESQMRFINSVLVCPHGVIEMAADMENFVQTSTNLAAIKTKEDHFYITTSQRSSVESQKYAIADRVAATFQTVGAKTQHGDGYPGWTPNPTSEIKDIVAAAYEKLFETKAEVKAIHAGLECGLIGDKYPNMDMISYGPTIRGAHSPVERLHIQSSQNFWKLTLEVLKNVPNR
ncbi:MAG: aminoacyl-histidine dipeptidase [Hyphomicrobiales bacterium]